MRRSRGAALVELAIVLGILGIVAVSILLSPQFWELVSDKRIVESRALSLMPSSNVVLTALDERGHRGFDPTALSLTIDKLKNDLTRNGSTEGTNLCFFPAWSFRTPNCSSTALTMLSPDPVNASLCPVTPPTICTQASTLLAPGQCEAHYLCVYNTVKRKVEMFLSDTSNT